MTMRSNPYDHLSPNMAAEERVQLRRLEIVACVEATTLVLLVGVAVPLKHFAGWPLGVKVLGPLHGLAFLSFFWIALQTVAGDDWTSREKARLLLLAFVPLGGYFNVPLIARKLRSLGIRSER